MLVHLHQYKREEVDFDDNRTTGESQTEDSVNPEAEEYFGADMDDLAPDVEEWETVEHDSDPIQRRTITVGEVVAISVPQEPAEDDDPDLPGRTTQIRTGGGETFIPQVEIIEVQDENPAES